MSTQTHEPRIGWGRWEGSQEQTPVIEPSLDHELTLTGCAVTAVSRDPAMESPGVHAYVFTLRVPRGAFSDGDSLIGLFDVHCPEYESPPTWLDRVQPGRIVRVNIFGHDIPRVVDADGLVQAPPAPVMATDVRVYVEEGTL